MAINTSKFPVPRFIYKKSMGKLAACKACFLYIPYTEKDLAYDHWNFFGVSSWSVGFKCSNCGNWVEVRSMRWSDICDIERIYAINEEDL